MAREPKPPRQTMAFLTQQLAATELLRTDAIETLQKERGRADAAAKAAAAREKVLTEENDQLRANGDAVTRPGDIVETLKLLLINPDVRGIIGAPRG